MDPRDVVDHIKGYVDPVIEYFKTANADDIGPFRNRGSSRAGVDQNCMQMMAIIDAVKEMSSRHVKFENGLKVKMRRAPSERAG